MHVKTTLAALLAALSLYAPSSFAALQYSDWKVAGDQQALVDTETGIEWLRLPNTKGMSMYQVKQLLATQFSGWRLPTAAEVEQMMDNYYPYTFNVGQTVYQWTTNDPLVKQWVTLFGPTSYFLNSGAETAHSYGMYYGNPDPYNLHIQMSGATFQDSWTAKNVHTYRSNIYEDYSSVDYREMYTSTTIGVFLVSDGGVTYSSLQNPTLNAMNPNAPVNNPVTPPGDGVSDVPVSGALGGVLLMLGLAGVRRAKK